MIKVKRLHPHNDWMTLDMSNVKIIVPADAKSMKVVLRGGSQFFIDTIINE